MADSVAGLANGDPFVIVADDHDETRYVVESLLAHAGLRVRAVPTGTAAWEEIRREAPTVAILDVMMPGLDGLELTRRIKSDPMLRTTKVLLITGQSDSADIVRALDLGADEYITKPLHGEELAARVRVLLRQAREAEEYRSDAARAREREQALARTAKGSAIVGQSPQMRQILSFVERIASVDAPVLIGGASGTGKELVARTIHERSNRASGPFIAINCAALNEPLLESELFGHLRGAFTGATRDRIGLFEAAHGGTLFLDEVGEMSTTLQAKLLRVLQEHRVMPVGGHREREVDVRIIAATNRDLLAMVDEGTFREDLFFRLNVLSVVVPRLAERREDIPGLAEHFLSQAVERLGARPKRFSLDTLDLLTRYQWRGNVRELKNEIERLVIMAYDLCEITAELVAPRILAVEVSLPSPTADSALSLRARAQELERSVIGEALAKHGGNRTRAAKELGMSRTVLIQKIAKYGLVDTGRRAI